MKRRPAIVSALLFSAVQQLPFHAFPASAAYDGAKALERHGLHAAQIAFKHPINKDKVTFKAPLPKDLQDLQDAILAANSI